MFMLKLISQDIWNPKLIYFNYVFLYGPTMDQTLDQISEFELDKCDYSPMS